VGGGGGVGVGGGGGLFGGGGGGGGGVFFFLKDRLLWACSSWKKETRVGTGGSGKCIKPIVQSPFSPGYLKIFF